MPYFYKVSDFITNKSSSRLRMGLDEPIYNEDLLGLLEFTIGDFVDGCEGPVKIFVFDLKGVRVKSVKSDEYFTKHEVGKERIITVWNFICSSSDVSRKKTGQFTLPGLKPPKLYELKTFIKDSYSLETSENELYLHISCKSNEPSITINGIYSEADMIHNMVTRIGDRGEKSSKSKSAARKGGRKLHKKSIKNHRKK